MTDRGGLPPRLRWHQGDEGVIRRVARHLDSGGLLAYPTETVYGLGAQVTAEGVRRVQALKGRDDARPFLLLVPHPSVPDLVWTDEARSLARTFWPGPLTLVLTDPEGAYPPGVRSDQGGVAIRWSSSPFVRALHRLWPHPLLSTSANLPGGAPARDPDTVEADFEPGGTHGLWIVDGGLLPVSPPSTVVDCTGTKPRVLREGAIPSRAVEKSLNLTEYD